jgi:2-(1,2-epoxy-1,2-dihydrophenyl)acetyl-CoA isomerase
MDMPDMAASIDTGTDQLLLSLEDGVATITLNRPEARNALSDTLTPALRRSLSAIAERDDVGAVVITGAGTAFCAGGDVKSMGSGIGGKPKSLEDSATQLRERQRSLTGVLVGLRVPTIAALPGAAAGAGLALALACDIRIAARSAFVTTGYARVGLSGDYGITWALTRLVGTARARELMFTARRVDAETCERLGLVNRVVDDDQLWSEARALARELAAGPRAAIAAMKDNLDMALSDGFFACLDHEADQLVRVARTDDHKEAVRAFVEKRPPRFGG